MEQLRGWGWLQDRSLWGADLSDANLHGASLRNAGLNLADLRWANLSNAVLISANFAEAVCSHTVFANVDLSNVEGLEAVEHRDPSPIDIDTLYQSKGQIPDVFLQGCGVPDETITYARSLVSKPTDFYSCFINYVHEDKSFARRLHDTLQGRGIRLWDKVILCASEHLLKSWWVDDELERAFAKERRLLEEYGREALALIPLNLDGYLFSENYTSPKKKQMSSRYAPSFVDWEGDHALFERQIEQVIAALRTDGGRSHRP